VARDISLVSGGWLHGVLCVWLNGVVWRSLSKQGLRCGGDSHWYSLGASLSIPYDSLIEKCSTLPRPCFSRA
jgi:hypothetical protein